MEKEHRIKEIRVLVQQSLFDKVQTKCEEEYRTISEIVRELLAKYVKGD